MRILLAILFAVSCTPPDTDSRRPNPPVNTPTTTEPACIPAAQVLINELSSTNQTVLLDEDGDSSDWLEIVNAENTPVDVGGWMLSDNDDEPAMWTLPSRVLEPGAFLVIYVSGKDRPEALHTHFKLRAAGERVWLFDSAGCEVDEADPGQMWSDQSYGRTLDGDFGYFMEPTPGSPNDTESRPGFAEKPVFSPAAGFFPTGTEVLVNAGAMAQIYVTPGGRTPTEDDIPYTIPALLDGATEAVVFRARAYEDGLWPSPIATATYFGREPGPLPVVSLVTNPPNLWDADKGIYTNFLEDWERPIHIAFWEPNGSVGFAVDAGVNIHGGWSRNHDQKSLRITARGGYGDPAMVHEVFPDLGITEFDSLVLRNSGNDWRGCQNSCSYGTHLRDALMHRITAGTDLDTMAYRPAEAYLNGEYWGIYNIRERPSASYVLEHHGIEDIDLLETASIPLRGDSDHYDDLLDYLRTSDPTDPAVYAEVEARVDLASFSNYFIFQIWFSNTDWPGNNVKFWRPRTADGRWRWLLYDTDFGLGLYNAASSDTLAFALETNGPPWPNPPWSTEILRMMLRIPAFRDDFINRYADLLNTQLQPEQTVTALEELVAGIAPVMSRHDNRWGSWGSWDSETSGVRQWLSERNWHATSHIVDNFGLAGVWTLELDVDPPGSGTFMLTTVEVDAPFAGTYFLGVPMTVTAVPAPGFSFAGWSDPGLPGATVTLDPAGPLQLTASFQ